MADTDVHPCPKCGEQILAGHQSADCPILAGVILLGSLSSANNQFGSGGIVLAGVFAAAIVGALFWVCGVMVAAQGQILRATLDTAVSASHFLTNPERADAMGLPRSVAEPREVQ